MSLLVMSTKYFRKKNKQKTIILYKHSKRKNCFYNSKTSWYLSGIQDLFSIKKINQCHRPHLAEKGVCKKLNKKYNKIQYT